MRWQVVKHISFVGASLFVVFFVGALTSNIGVFVGWVICLVGVIAQDFADEWMAGRTDRSDP